MRSDGLLLSAGAARTSKSLFTVGHHRIKQIPFHLMPGGALLIRVVESEKCGFVAVIALYTELSGEYRANGSAELHSSYSCLV
jgi:hypothetical protein